MRLTRLGWGVGATGVALLGLGIVLGLPVVAAIGAFMLVLTASSMLIVAEVPQVKLARVAVPAEAERGAPAEVRLHFQSTSTKRPRPLTVIETVDGEQRIASIGPMTPQGTDHVTYAIATSRRGVVTAGPLVVRSFDPFGLVSADRRFTSTCTVSVRPRRYPLRMLPSGRQRDLEGPTRERSEGSASFHQLREYVPGDDLRRIHWRSTARTGALLVKQMVDTTRPELVVVLDNRAAAVGADDFEEAVDIVASVVAAAEADDYPVALVLTDGSSDVDVDGQRIPPIDRLTAVTLGDADSLERLTEVVMARGRSLLVVTGEPSAVDLLSIGKLARGFVPAHLVSVARERDAPLVAAPGTRAIACADAAEFVGLWTAMR